MIRDVGIDASIAGEYLGQAVHLGIESGATVIDVIVDVQARIGPRIRVVRISIVDRVDRNRDRG